MTFLYPHVLIALLLPLLLGLGIIALRHRARAAWRMLISPKHPELVHCRPHWQSVLPPLLGLLALTGIIISAARPINGYGQSDASASGRNLLIALDISRSMETQDVAPSRLEEARAAAYELIDALPGDKIGLIVFAGEADVVVPLTYDHTALRDALEQVNPGWAGYGGTNFGMLLRSAMQNFARSAPDGANALIILSDGEDTVDSSLEVAEEAKKKNLLVITVGIGTPAGGAIPDPQGENGLWQDASGRHVISKLDMNSLKRFAEATGGAFFTMSSGADLSAFAREAANKLDRHEEHYSTGRVPLDLFMWFALPSLLALIAAIIMSSQWKAPKLTPLLLLAAGLGTHAEAAAHGAAYEQGINALQSGETSAALERFSEALLSDNSQLQAAGHHAIGNIQTRASFEKLRQLYEGGDDASQQASPGIEALESMVEELKKDLIPYQDALKADTRLSSAQSNIEKVEALIKVIEEEIERLKQQQDQQQNQNDRQKQDQQQNQDDQQKQDQQQDQDDQQKQDQQQDQDDQQKQDQQQDQNDRQKQDQQQDQNDQQKQDQQQDQNDRQQQDQQQDQNDQQQQDQQQDQNDQQQQDQQQNQDDRQQQDQQQNQDDRQQQDQQQNAQESASAEPKEQELSEEEKGKQRAAGILRMHLDEEKGSPIPHHNRPVRPPSKDY